MSYVYYNVRTNEQGSYNILANKFKFLLIGLLSALFLVLGSGIAKAADTHTVCPSVCDFPDIQSAIDDAGTVDGDTIQLNSNLLIGHRVDITKEITINGQGYTLSPTFTETGNSNNATLEVAADNITISNLTIDGSGGTNLHGINTYKSLGTLIDGVTINNNDHTGLVVNGSNVAANNISTSGNGWHAINVDQGGGVTEPSILTINGTSVHSETVPDIYVDDSTKDVTVNDTNNQYGSVNLNLNGTHPNDLAYKLRLPAPDLVSPANNSFVNAISPIANDWDDVAGADHYTYESYNVDGSGNCNPGDTRWNEDYSTSETNSRTISDGLSFCWRVKSVDSYGIESDWSELWKVTIDNTKPDASITAPFDESTQSGSFKVEGTATDDSSGIDQNRVLITVNEIDSLGGIYQSGTHINQEQTSFDSLSGTFEYDVNGLDTGFYRIQVRAYDNASNVRYKNIDVEVDADRPVNNLIEPAANTTQPGTFTVRGTAVDNETDIDKVEILVTRYNSDGSFGGYVVNRELATYNPVTNEYEHEVTLGTDMGQGYRVHSIAYDEAGNTHNSANRPVYVDADKPNVDIVSPDNGVVLNSAFTVEGTSSDNETSISEVKYTVTKITGIGCSGCYVSTIDSGSATGTNNWEFDVSELPEGFYRLKVQAFDAVWVIGSTNTMI